MGEFFGQSAGLYYLRARYYNPGTGRFISEDSCRGDSKDPSSLNLYTYCHNDPVNYVDPSGHLTQHQQDNINSAYNAWKGGYITKEQYEENVKLNGGSVAQNTDNGRTIHTPDIGALQLNEFESAVSSEESKTDEVVMYNGETGYSMTVLSDQVDSFREQGWYTATDRVIVYNSYDLTQSEAYGSEIYDKINGDETGAWYTSYMNVNIYDAVTGEMMNMPAWKAYEYVKHGQAYTANQAVPMYDAITGVESYAMGYEISQKRAGDETGRWYTANEQVTLYNSLTGEASSAYAYEIYQKRMGDDTGTWYTANERVMMYDSLTGKSSYVWAYEIYGKRQGDWTGKWYTANESVALYDDLGRKSYAYAYEIYSKRQGDKTGRWHTGQEGVTVYEYYTGNKSHTTYSELAQKRVGDQTGQWGIVTERIPVYSKVEGRVVYVQANGAKDYLENDSVLYSKSNRKPGKTPPKRWPELPNSLAGKKAKWNPDGYWQGKEGNLTWDDHSHGAGVNRGNGEQDGHWDDEKSNRRWNRNGNLLPSIGDGSWIWGAAGAAANAEATAGFLPILIPTEVLESWKSFVDPPDIL